MVTNTLIDLTFFVFMKMTTEAVPSFTPKFGGIEDCKSFTNIELKEQVSLDYRNGYHSGVKRYGMPLDELDTIRDGDFPIRMKKVKDNEKDLISKENEHNVLNGTSKVNGDTKKKRNTRKRNRSDMSPEELRRLRERERKAQQSRRDRIRAQKKQNQAWHDDEAAWEAFLDQTDEKRGVKTNRKHSSAIPSMVCAIESNHVKPDMGDDGEKIQDESKNLEKQSSHETESIAESNPSAYTSDDNSNHGSSKDGSKKSSKEQFSDNESHDDREEISSKDRSVKEESKNNEMIRHDHHSEHERNNSSMHPDKRHHRPYYLSSPPPPHNPYHAKVSPHSHHTREYYPTLYAPDSHHPHYSPLESKHYLSGPRHHHESRHESHYHHHHDSYEKKGTYKHYYPPHFIPIIHSQPDSPNRESKHKQSSSPHCEKKKMISRNVDRKKLSEEELEELRRRERDYQRERRARIRMEKAKTQAEQERFHKARDILPSGYYHRHPADVYRHVHHHERSISARYDAPEHYAHRQLSPNASKYNHRKSTEKPQHSEQLEVKIPDHQVEEKKAEKPETDLLQVVPKTRDCEEKHIPPTATSSPVEEEPMSKKSLLETICSSLKKDSTEWNDKSDDTLIIDLKEEEKKESPKEFQPDLAKLKEELISKDFRAESQQSDDQKLRDKMTEDQLERRRRSNREAQRRRRARLKMQGHMEERHEFEHHGEEIEKEKDVYDARKDQMKARPDTLYMQNLHDIYPHRGSRHHEHVYLPHEKYGHHIPNEHFSYKPYLYHRPMHQGMDMDDSPRHHPHLYYDALRSPDYHHRERLVHHHHPHLPHHHEKVEGSKSPHAHNHEDKRRNSVPRNDENSPSHESSTCKNNESRDSRDDSTSEHDVSIKSGGGRKKRKQFAPRKLASSANTTPDEYVDIMTDTQNVVILNGPDEKENVDCLLNNQADVSEEE